MATNTAETINNVYSPIILNAGLAGLLYPFYRYFSQIRVTHLMKDFRPEMIAEAKSLVGKNGVFRGFLSYFVSATLPTSSNLLVSSTNPGALILPLSLFVLSYPLKINSLLRSLELPGYVSLKDVTNYSSLFFDRSNYKGILACIRASSLYLIPFLNYFSHSIESSRIAFILGQHYGHEFKTFSDAKHYLKTNNLLRTGRAYYNLPLHVYNVVFPAYIYSIASQQSNKIKTL